MARSTIADVARLAGVSVATVSRSLNGNPSVDPALAERVRAAAIELQYSASPLARSLVLGRTATIAVVVPDLGNPTFQEVLRGLSLAAKAEGYHVLVADSAEAVEEERALALDTRRRTDGVVLVSPRMPDDELAALLPELAPVVLVNRWPDAVPAVGADYGAGVTALLEHLHGLGHRSFAYLAGLERSVSNAARVAAIEAFVRGFGDGTGTDGGGAVGETARDDAAAGRSAAGDAAAVVHRLPGGVDFDAGAAAADAVLATGATAVLAFNDLVAMGLMSTLQGRGVDVPGALSIVGYDDIPFAAYTSPPLTTAAVPTRLLGEQAWAAMSAALGGAGAALADDAASAHPLLVPQLVVRGSSGPAAR